MRFYTQYVGTKPPLVEDIWVIVPLSRPWAVPRVRGNVERQRIKPKVCVVENGLAVGACAAAGYEPDVLLTSDQHQSSARNAALEYLKDKHPAAYWVSMDDDDYYSSEYVAEHAGLAARGQCVGKSTHWVLFEGRFLALLRPWASSGSGKIVNGGSIGAFVAESPEFVKTEVGEDGIFSRTFLARGGKVWMSSPYHVAYCRRNGGRVDHTFLCTDKDFLYHMGSQFLVFPPDRLDFVGAEVPLVGGKLFTHPEMPE